MSYHLWTNYHQPEVTYLQSANHQPKPSLSLSRTGSIPPCISELAAESVETLPERTVDRKCRKFPRTNRQKREVAYLPLSDTIRASGRRLSALSRNASGGGSGALSAHQPASPTQPPGGEFRRGQRGNAVQARDPPDDVRTSSAGTARGMLTTSCPWPSSPLESGPPLLSELQRKTEHQCGFEVSALLKSRLTEDRTKSVSC